MDRPPGPTTQELAAYLADKAVFEALRSALPLNDFMRDCDQLLTAQVEYQRSREARLPFGPLRRAVALIGSAKLRLILKLFSERGIDGKRLAVIVERSRKPTRAQKQADRQLLAIRYGTAVLDFEARGFPRGEAMILAAEGCELSIGSPRGRQVLFREFAQLATRRGYLPPLLPEITGAPRYSRAALIGRKGRLPKMRRKTAVDDSDNCGDFPPFNR